MLRELEWVREASLQYTVGEEMRVRVETYPTRASESVALLDRKVLPAVREPNILLVGLGLTDGTLQCVYTPFLIAAHLEAKRIPYKMILVDVSEAVIDDVRSRTHLFMTNSSYYEDERYKAFWDQYLVTTQQTDTVVHDKETIPGVRFTDYVENYERTFPASWYLKGGVRAARVPEGFSTKLGNGDITLVEDDIALVDLKGHGRFDYVECLNILYQLPPAGQVLALANITDALRLGGRVYLNDLEYVGTPLFDQLGGWLTDDKLKQLDLIKEEFEDKTERIEDVRESYTLTSARALLRKEEI